MNTKTAILATALGLALASGASAQTVLRLTGATAFRASVHSAILNVMTDEKYAYTGATLNGAGQAIFTGKIGGQDVIVKTSWSGSALGIRDVAQGRTVSFLPDSTSQTTTGSSGAAAGTEGGIPDVAMSDVFQASTIYTTPALVDTPVAVVPFVWVANDGAPAGLTNMTPGAVQNLYLNGRLPLALFTGSAADRNTPVYALGRDPESGTRITAMAESGTGAFATVGQYSVTVSNDTITSPVPWPQGTTPYIDGNGGYSSGGTLAATLAARSPGAVYVSYLGLSDANNTAVAGGARTLSWNGVPYSETAVREGQYSFWGYQHFFHRSDLSGTRLTVANAVKNFIISTPGSAGIALSTMQVSRGADGAPIGEEY